MEAKKIDLQEWVPFGGGGFGQAFHHRTDDSVVLKLNKPSVTEEKAREEFLRSKAVYGMGVPSAEPYDFVTDGERFGMTVQRIHGKESFGRIIADDPGRLEELAATTADMAKALHSMPCDTGVFDSVALGTRRMIAAEKALPDDVKARVVGYIDELEPATTCLHGDLNPCNIITAGGKVYWIDLGDFGYGDPLLDFTILAHLSSHGTNPLLRMLFHMDRTTLAKFYHAMGRRYFGPAWDTPDQKERMRRISQIMAAKSICIWPDAHHVNLPYLRGRRLAAAFNLFIGDRMKVK